jgi:hypothetical protein
VQKGAFDLILPEQQRAAVLTAGLLGSPPLRLTGGHPLLALGTVASLPRGDTVAVRAH